MTDWTKATPWQSLHLTATVFIPETAMDSLKKPPPVIRIKGHVAVPIENVTVTEVEK